MVVLRRSDENGKGGIWCDPCIAPIVEVLNSDKGGHLRTVASCCGHGEQDGSILLADGRELVIRAGDRDSLVRVGVAEEYATEPEELQRVRVGDVVQWPHPIEGFYEGEVTAIADDLAWLRRPPAPSPVLARPVVRLSLLGVVPDRTTWEDMD